MASADIRTRPKNLRKPQNRSLPLREAIAEVAADYERMTIRQLYYQLVSRGALEKTESAYKRTSDAATQMRINGSLSYGKIADGSRSRRAIRQFGNMGEALKNAHEAYRRNYWLDQPVHIEVWSEKDALTGVIEPVCQRFGVPYVATRGFPSVTLLYESAYFMKRSGKPAIVYFFGDHDASGQQISSNLEDDLRKHGATVSVFRIALNPDQIREYALPTRPGKQSDSRQAGFVAKWGSGDSVELDALRPDLLTDLVEDSIREFIDQDAWDRTEEVEELERMTLESIASFDVNPGTLISLSDGEAA